MADLPRHPPEARQDPPGTDRRTHTAWDVLTSHPASTSSPRGQHTIKAPLARPPHPRDISDASKLFRDFLFSASSLFLTAQAGLPSTHLSLHLSRDYEILFVFVCLYCLPSYGGIPRVFNPACLCLGLISIELVSLPSPKEGPGVLSPLFSPFVVTLGKMSLFPTTPRVKSEAELNTSP